MEACVGDLQEAFKEVGLCCDWMLSGCGNISTTGHLNHLIYRKMDQSQAEGVTGKKQQLTHIIWAEMVWYFVC